MRKLSFGVNSCALNNLVIPLILSEIDVFVPHSYFSQIHYVYLTIMTILYHIKYNGDSYNDNQNIVFNI